MRLHLARADARIAGDGLLVLLRGQDRRQWDRAAIAETITLVERAGRPRKPGPLQLQAAIAACHAEAPSRSETDWPQILVLYDLVLRLAPSPIARLNRAVAVRHVAGPEAALADVRALEPELEGYYLWHAAYAELLLEVGQRELARAAALRALRLADNPGEQSLLRKRLASDTC